MARVRKTPCRYQVGQVVRLNIPYYQGSERAAQQYQRVTSIAPWIATDNKQYGWELTFLNGDRCNDKYAKPLTAKERGK